MSTQTSTPKFGRGVLPRRDARTDAYRIRDHVPATDPARRRLWTLGPLLDQGRHGTCVGHGITTELLAAPATDPVATADLGHAYALNHYRRARVLGGMDPDDLDGGAYLHDGMQAARDRGLITSYLWGKTTDEVRDALTAHGPVIMATPWPGRMDICGSTGNVTVPKTISLDEAHCYAITGYDPAREFAHETVPAYRITNSWGEQWGREVDPKGAKTSHFTGSGWVRETDLQRLIDAWGDYDACCVPVSRGPVDLTAQLAAHPDPTVS
jgi:hypothetical protein